MADVRAVLRVLAGADVELVVVDDGGGDEVVLVAAAARLERRRLRVAVKLPQQLATLRLEAVKPAIAAGEDRLALALDHRVGGTGPLPIHDVLARGAVLPLHLAGLLVDCDEARGLRSGQLVVAIDAVAGDDEDEV